MERPLSGSTLRLPLPRPALRRGPALARLLRVHALAPVAVYSVRGSLELCARRRAPPTSVVSVAVWAGAGPLARRYGHSRHLRCETALRAHRWRLSAGQLCRRGPAREQRQLPTLSQLATRRARRAASCIAKGRHLSRRRRCRRSCVAREWNRAAVKAVTEPCRAASAAAESAVLIKSRGRPRALIAPCARCEVSGGSAALRSLEACLPH